MPCIETTSESRPNRVTNQGTPAAGMKTPLANVGSSSWSEAMSSWAWSQARRTVWFGVSRRTRRSCGWPWSGNGPATALHASVLGRRFELVSGSQRRQVCQTPFGGDLGDEHEPAVGELRLAVGAVRLDDQLAHEVAVDVGRPQLARRAEPARVDLAAADEPAGLDVEDVGEVGLDLDLDRQADRAAARS